jgi:hypothetical protein
MNLESYEQDFTDPSGYSSKNVYTFIRGEKNFAHESILLSFDTGIYSVSAGLKVLYQLKFSPFNWVHKDIIFVFYQNTSNQLGMKNFLDLIKSRKFSDNS